MTPELQMPEWLLQYAAIHAGEKTWDDYSFEERTCKGWLTPFLMGIETRYWGRWEYWVRTLEAGELLDEPIPQIAYLGEGDSDNSRSDAMKMLRNCVESHHCYSTSARLPDFFEWLLWGFGDAGQKERARIDEKVNEHWYRTFNLGLMIACPSDYLGELLSERKGSGKWNNPNAFYPTPHNVVDMMTKMTMHDIGDRKEMSVMDPCVGTGRMLMYASNHSVNLYGVDNDYVCVAACKVNGWLYMPWLVRPAPWLKASSDVEISDLMEAVPDVKPPTLQVIKKQDQMRLF